MTEPDHPEDRVSDHRHASVSTATDEMIEQAANTLASHLGYVNVDELDAADIAGTWAPSVRDVISGIMTAALAGREQRLARYAQNLSVNAQLILTGADIRMDAVTVNALRRGGLLDEANELTEEGCIVVGLLRSRRAET